MATADRPSPAASHGGSDGPEADRIVTARLKLVPLAVGDAEEMVGVLGDERLYAFTGGRPPTLAELRARYAQLVVGRSPDGTEQWRNWIVRLRDGRAVGTVQATITAGGRPDHHRPCPPRPSRLGRGGRPGGTGRDRGGARRRTGLASGDHLMAYPGTAEARIVNRREES
jgi:hypothetical protein